MTHVEFSALISNIFLATSFVTEQDRRFIPLLLGVAWMFLALIVGVTGR